MCRTRPGRASVWRDAKWGFAPAGTMAVSKRAVLSPCMAATFDEETKSCKFTVERKSQFIVEYMARCSHNKTRMGARRHMGTYHSI